MSDTETLLEESVALDHPWLVVVYDDPVNTMDYVTLVFMNVLGVSRPRAEKLMMEVHELGRSIVWTGERERAELYTQQLQGYQLKTAMEKAEG
jgi:ATP-dependent Clp protease adaptor protein ClpS